jgi:hypothetical protein
VTVEAIASRIVVLRGQKVLLDADLAVFYAVETRVLVQAVKRNLDRFPGDFMFRLSNQELAALRSQTVISSATHGGRRYAPYAFTEHGVAMLSSVLNSTQAIRVNIAIMRAFVKLRETLAANKELAARFEELARKVDSHDQAIAGLIATIRELMNSPPTLRKRSIGFG